MKWSGGRVVTNSTDRNAVKDTTERNTACANVFENVAPITPVSSLKQAKMEE